LIKIKDIPSIAALDTNIDKMATSGYTVINYLNNALTVVNGPCGAKLNEKAQHELE